MTSCWLRGFGKLPSSREFLHLNVGEGLAKVAHDWFTAGHQAWIKHIPADSRGQVVTSHFALKLPELSNHVAIGCLWNSRDSASRVFPFGLFVLMKNGKDRGWAEKLLIAQQIWMQISPIYDSLLTNPKPISDLRNATISLDINGLQRQAGDLSNELEGIKLSDWLSSVTYCEELANVEQFIKALRQKFREWKSNDMTGVRFPLICDYSIQAQLLTWLSLLENNLTDKPAQSIIASPDNGSSRPAVSVVFKSLSLMDFQLFTTDAKDFGAVDQFCSARQSLQNKTETESSPKIAELADKIKRLSNLATIQW